MQVFNNIANTIRRFFGFDEKKVPVQKLEKKPDSYGDYLKEMTKELN